MSENEFHMLNFYHLLDKTFWIPYYQRGYRWEKQQVEDLLNDLAEFIVSACQPAQENKVPFYCLQPVVVKPRNGSKTEFDVIDGQQRLTTVYLILTYLENTRMENCDNRKLYKIEFERVLEQEKHYLSDRTFVDDLKKYQEGDLDSCVYPSNIDSFFIFQAYRTISEWFENGHRSLKVNMAKVFTGELTMAEDERLKDVCVIWYEIDDADDTAPIDAFARLNAGQIKLTEAELVKALLLQSGCYDKDEQSRRKEVAFRHSCEWDSMEKKLQDGNFWAMLAPKDWNPQSHIDLVISFVAKVIKDTDPKRYDYSEDKKGFSFLVINQYIKNSIKEKKSMVDAVDEVWDRIQDTFNVFYNWFLDRDFYHLIGLLTLLSNNGKKEQIKFEKGLFDIFYANTKVDAKKKLRAMVGEKIRVRGNIPQNSIFSKGNDLEQSFQLQTINYEDSPQQVIRVLEAFNVYMYIVDTSHDSVFQFDKFRQYGVTSLEHIHPQHLNTVGMTFEEVCRWFDDRKDKIADNVKTIEAKRDLERIIAEVNAQVAEKDKRAVFQGYSNDIARCESVIDESFDELAGMKPENMHTLGNMALVDKDTNSAISNNYLYVKRNTLRSRENAGLTYVPAGTKAVFDKQFSNEITDMKFWSPNDRKAYYSKIEEAYEYFTDSLNSKEND